MTASQKTQKTSSHSNTPTTSNGASTPPWSEPELEFNAELLLENIRETQQMMDNLKSRKEAFLNDLFRAYEAGLLEEYQDATDPKKINFTGVTFTCTTRKRKVWDDEVKKQIQDIESKAKMMGLYREVEGDPFWTTRLETL